MSTPCVVVYHVYFNPGWALQKQLVLEASEVVILFSGGWLIYPNVLQARIVASCWSWSPNKYIACKNNATTTSTTTSGVPSVLVTVNNCAEACYRRSWATDVRISSLILTCETRVQITATALIRAQPAWWQRGERYGGRRTLWILVLGSSWFMLSSCWAQSQNKSFEVTFHR